MKGALDSIKLQMLRTEIVRNVRNREILGGYIFKAKERYHYPAFGRASGWAHNLLSLAFAAEWNPKHPSYCKCSVVL